MKRSISLLTALMVVVAAFATMTDSVEAGLFKRRNKCCKKTTCCEPVSCCEPAPCCEATPCCEEAAPCGCEAAAPCGCEAAAPCCESSCNTCCLNKRQIRRMKRKGCCVQQCSCETSCGCESACGCEAAAPCGCEGGTVGCEGGDCATPTEAGEKAPDLPEDATT